MRQKHPAIYGCPLCNFRSKNEEDVAEHMIDMADDPMHEDFDDLELKDDEFEQVWNQQL